MNNLLRLIGNRLLWLPIMVFGVTVLVFFLMSLSPIDPAFSALGENASPDQLEAYRVEHGLNDPLIVRYGDYMVGFFHGDLGTFGPSNQSVSARIATALPITLQLGFFGFIIAIVASAILGVVSACIATAGPTRLSASSPSPASPRRRSGCRCCSSCCSPPRCTCCRPPAPCLRSRKTPVDGLRAWPCPASPLPCR